MERQKKGIEIQRQAFDSLVLDHINRMKAGNTPFSGTGFILPVKIWNTINAAELYDKAGPYKEFYDLFYPDLFKLAAAELDAGLTKGMAFYSEEHDLWLGGKLNGNSYFSFVNGDEE